MRHLTVVSLAATAMLLLAAPPATAAKKSVYAGGINRGEPIVLTADSKATKLKSAVIAVTMECLDGTRLPPFAAAVTPETVRPGFEPAPGTLVMSANAKGKFKGTLMTGITGEQYSVGAVITLTGKFTKKIASGTLVGMATVFDETNAQVVTTCQTGGSKFKISRAPGLVYGGSTTQGEPIVLNLNASRSRVANLMFSWQAACDNVDWGGFHLGLDGFRNVPLTRAGSFSFHVSPLYDRADGGKNVFDYEVKGKLSKTAASGSLTFSYTSFDSAGTREGGCNTGAMSFKALSG